MKNTLIAAVAFGLLAGGAQAATSGTTVSAAVNPYLGSAPVTGYVSATVTSTNGTRAALPSTSKTINAMACTVVDSAGRIVPRDLEVSGTDILIGTATGMASGTVATGDQLNCVLSYER